MAELGVLFWTIKADDTQAKQSMKTMRDEASKTDQNAGKSMVNFAKTLASVAAAYAVVKGVVVETVQAYMVQEDAETRLEAVIAATGQAAGFTADQMKAMASEMQNTTTFGDEMVLGAQAILATFKSISGDTFPRTIEAAADLSAVFGQSLQQSTTMLGKALEDPITGMGALRRVGVTLSEQTQELVKDFVALGEIEKAQNEILKAVEGQVKGTAAAMADTGAGKIRQLDNAFGDLKEMLGGFIVDALIPAIDGLTMMTSVMKDLFEVVKILAAPLTGMIKAVGEQIKLYANVYSGLKNLITGQKGYNEEVKNGTIIIDNYYQTQLLYSARVQKQKQIELEKEKLTQKEREKINKDYNDKYFELTHSEIEVLKKKRDEEIKAAHAVGANRVTIKKYYDELIRQAEQELSDEKKAIEEEEAERFNKAREEKLASLGLDKDAKLELEKEFYDAAREMAEEFQQAELERLEELRQSYEDMAENIINTMGDIVGSMIEAGMAGEDVWEAFGEAAKEAIASAVKALGKQWAVQAAAAWIPGPTFNPVAAIGLTAASIAAFAAAALIPSLDTGGLLTEDSLIQAHKNEVVIPLEKLENLLSGVNTGGGGNVYVVVNSGPINNEMDVDRIFQQAGQKLKANLRRF